jgi:hypothetical protein
MSQATIIRTVKRLGNRAMVPVQKADLEKTGTTIGSAVQVNMQRVDETYDATRKSALKMRQRFTRTLELLGKLESSSGLTSRHSTTI